MSIPIIVAGSQIVLKLMDRFPWIITAGGMLLGWIAGQMAFTDPALKSYVPELKAWEYGAAAAGAVLVLLIGKMVYRRSTPDAA